VVYVDTSIIVKLYIKEKYSRDASTWLKANNEAVPLTSFHELEFFNAIHLKLFRNETTPQTIQRIKASFEEHEKGGIYYRPPLDWPAVFIHATELSKKHSASLGSRALDILHVASALSIHADRFLTLDDRQSKLAALAGLEISDIFQTAK
jgi:predicted nucleic acid-binding protein